MNQFWDQLGTGLGDILINTQQPFGTLGGPPLSPEQRSPVIQQGLLSLGANILADNTRNPFQALGQGYNATRAQGAANQLGGLRANMDQTALNQNLFELSNAQKRKKAQDEYAKTLDPAEAAKFRADPEGYMQQALQAQFAPQDAGGIYGNGVVGTDGQIYYPAKDGSGMVRGAFPEGVNPITPDQMTGLKEGAKIEPKGISTMIDEWFKPNGIQTRVQAAQRSLESVKQAKQALENGIQSGSGAEIINSWRGVGKTLGFNVDDSVLSDTQKYQSFVYNVVIPRMAELGGNDSEEELRAMMKTTGGDINLQADVLASVINLVEANIRKQVDEGAAVYERIKPFIGNYNPSYGKPAGNDLHSKYGLEP